MPAFNKFHYEPLCAEDAIRFIVLHPATDEEDPLSCSIIQHRRSVQIVDYSAVSYAWGEPKFSQNLEIRCDDDTSYLKITPNLDAFLRRLRVLNMPHRLWIDAICLNQADEIEKAQQIPMMGRIFGEAKVVHIWLGPEDCMTAKLFAFFQQACLLSEVKKAKMASHIAILMRKVFGGGDGLRALECLCQFSDRPLFSRRWIIQEACLAQKATVHCGSHSIPLPLLVLAAIRFQTLDMSSYPIKVMANLRRPITKLTILELLWNFHEARCLEPKDRIAALLGLVPDNHRFHLDFTIHWTELYKQVVLGVFGFGNNDIKLQVLLHLFEFGSVSLPEDIAYPSWVPNWSKSRRRDLPYHSPIRNPDTYEPYPTSPGHSEKAALTFHHDALQIHWHASIGGPRGRQVIYVTRFELLAENEDQNKERVVNVLHKLFPPTSDSTLRILAVSYLLKMIIEFRHSSRDRRLNSSSLDKYIRDVSQRLPKSTDTELFNSLRKLDSLLQEFCLFELESLLPRSEASAGYGISSQQIQVRDVLIPLWNIEWKPDRHKSLLSQRKTAINMTTMLAVRRIKEQPRQYAIGVSDTEKPVETSRIVGSAVCVLLESKWGYEHGLSVDAKWDDHLDRKQRCLMRLV